MPNTLPDMKLEDIRRAIVDIPNEEVLEKPVGRKRKSAKRAAIQSRLPPEAVRIQMIKDNKITFAQEQVPLKMSQMEMAFIKTNYDADNYLANAKIHCTVCNTHIGTSLAAQFDRYVHPELNVLLCQSCYISYSNVVIELDDVDGSERQCKWCGLSGSLYCCSTCSSVFCEDCVLRNLGKSQHKQIKTSENWHCFICAPTQIMKLHITCNLLHNYTMNQLLNCLTSFEVEEKLPRLLKDISTCCKHIKRGADNSNEEFRPNKKLRPIENSTDSNISLKQENPEPTKDNQTNHSSPIGIKEEIEDSSGVASINDSLNNTENLVLQTIRPVPISSLLEPVNSSRIQNQVGVKKVLGGSPPLAAPMPTLINFKSPKDHLTCVVKPDPIPVASGTLQKSLQSGNLNKPVESASLKKPIQSGTLNKPLQNKALNKLIQSGAQIKTIEPGTLNKLVQSGTLNKPLQIEALNIPIHSGSLNKAIPSATLNQSLRNGNQNKPLQPGTLNKPPLQSGALNRPIQSGKPKKPIESGTLNKHLQSGTLKKPIQSGTLNKPIQPVVPHKLPQSTTSNKALLSGTQKIHGHKIPWLVDFIAECRGSIKQLMAQVNTIEDYSNTTLTHTELNAIHNKMLGSGVQCINKLKEINSKMHYKYLLYLSQSKICQTGNKTQLQTTKIISKENTTQQQTNKILNKENKGEVVVLNKTLKPLQNIVEPSPPPPLTFPQMASSDSNGLSAELFASSTSKDTESDVTFIKKEEPSEDFVEYLAGDNLPKMTSLDVSIVDMPESEITRCKTFAPTVSLANHLSKTLPKQNHYNAVSNTYRRTGTKLSNTPSRNDQISNSQATNPILKTALTNEKKERYKSLVNKGTSETSKNKSMQGFVEKDPLSFSDSEVLSDNDDIVIDNAEKIVCFEIKPRAKPSADIIEIVD